MINFPRDKDFTHNRLINMAEPEARGDAEALPDEPFGNFMLKRKKDGTGYLYVTKPGLSKQKPYQARIKNKRTMKTQHLGNFATAQIAAVEVAKALQLRENEDMNSPRKHAKRGMCHHPVSLSLSHVPSPLWFRGRQLNDGKVEEGCVATRRL